MPRDHYIDRIRVILTGLVILHHTAITYGGPGGWYYREVPASLSPTGILFVLFCSVNQAYFMGFFFLLAGYFTPASYGHKGPLPFVWGRLIRLGIPLLVFAVLLDPLTNALAQTAADPPASAKAFLTGYLHRVLSVDWYPGPLWFAEALLLFSLAYVLWRRFSADHPPNLQTPIPSPSAWLLSALAVGTASLLIRQWFPVGATFMRLQLGYFSSYIFLFALGTVACQHAWLQRITWKIARPWIFLSVALLPVMLVAAFVAGRFSNHPAHYGGGFSWPAVLYAFWEPFIAWGIIAGCLLWFRAHSNQPSRVWTYLAARAYAVYILHAPVLVGISVALAAWMAPPLAKFVVTSTLAGIATLALSSLLLWVPGARSVV